MRLFLAEKEHDQALRDLVEKTPLPGWIHLAFCREPDFFQGLSVQGEHGQVIAAAVDNLIVGMGCRTIRSAYVNGKQSKLGYLSGLRILPSARRTTLLGRGYHFLKELHDQDGLVPAYLTTIIDGNKDATALLTSKRAGLPHYLDHGRLITYAIDAHRSSKLATLQEATIKSGSEVPLADIVMFINAQGARKQFYPVLKQTDFDSDILRGLRQKDFIVAYYGNEIVGTLADWNQSCFKQYVVKGYSPSVAVLRPFMNVVFSAINTRVLPVPGEHLSVSYASFVCVRDDNPAIFAEMIHHLCLERGVSSNHYILVGLHERDPLNQGLKRFRSLKYMSRIYVVCWEDGLGFVKNIDHNRGVYVEVATL